MDFMSLHLQKMRELQEYRQARKKANLIANILNVCILIASSVIVWLMFIGG